MFDCRWTTTCVGFVCDPAELCGGLTRAWNSFPTRLVRLGELVRWAVRDTDLSSRKTGRYASSSAGSAGRDAAPANALRSGDNTSRTPARSSLAAKRDLSESPQTIWDGMRKHLKLNYPTLCRQWFDELRPLGIFGGALELRSKSNLHRDYLRRQCADAFNDASRTVSRFLLSIRFLGPDDASGAESDSSLTTTAPIIPATAEFQILDDHAPITHARPTKPINPIVVEPTFLAESQAPYEVIPTRKSALTVHEPPPRYETLVVNPDYSFDNFVVGPNNRLAHAGAKAVADNPGHAYNPLFIHGGVGLGKTHLLQAICMKIVERNPSCVLYYQSCESFVTQYLDSVAAGEMSQFRHRFRDVDVLIIDDIHFLTKRGRSQEEFFHTFNSLIQGQKQMILSSDAPPEDIPDLEERLVSRFKWGLVAHIDSPDYETRIEIVKSKARLRGITIPDDAAAYVAQHLDTNIREIEGAITKLQLQALVENAPISADMARRSITEKSRGACHEPTIQSIIGVVTDFYQVRLSDMQSKVRQRSIALPRHVCMYLARKCTRLSLEEIGGFFGGRDHTTVMHAVKTVESRVGTDPEFVALLTDLEHRSRTPGIVA